MKFKIHSTRRALLATIMLTGPAWAADVYWDIDGATAGAGGTAPAGTWSTAATNWSADSAGGAATAAWVNGDSAIFSAGTNATGTFTVTNSGVTVDNITQQEGKITINSSTLTLADTSMTLDVQTRTTGDYDLRINSVIANSGAGASGIIKNGAGILHMGTGTNTFSGGLTLNNGTVAIESSGGALGTGTLTFAGGNFVKSWGTSGSATATVSNAMNVTGTTNVGIVQGQPGNLEFTGTWGAGSTSGNFNVGNTSINGFAVQSSTIQVRGDVSAYTGTFSHNNLASGGNRLRFGSTNGGNVGFDAAKARFVLSGSTTGTNVVDLADGTYGTFKIGELSGTGGRLRAGFASAGNTTFEVGALNTSSSFAGLLDNNANGANGLAALKKVGTGALALSLAGGNSYSAGTTVTEGTLLAANTTGSATGTGAVTVNGGRLGGTGVIAPTGTNGINVTTGVIAPGGVVSSGAYSDSIGNLGFNLGGTTGTITMAAGTGLEFELGTAGVSLTSVGNGDLVTLLGASAGDFTFNANSVDFKGTGGTGFYKLFDTSLDGTTWSGLTFDGTTGLVSSGLSVTNLTSGFTGNFIVGTAGNGGNLGDIYLQVQAVPEPGTALLGGGAALLVLRRRRNAAGG
ncbi:autotransporter-associated beta strand repeat-containing protein [Luteolibacter sp. LG18]|uniref:beta strand repeat-containing protein n=1 Tax=Luteolibacter sp. LG18 TaxID=2819286 RepID=UPI002B27E1D9|nr:hypothetical protein llg_25190 [Luteolibacter sp. LG18]